MSLVLLRLVNGDIVVGERQPEFCGTDGSVAIANPFKYMISYIGEKASAGFVPYVPFMDEGRSVVINGHAVVYETSVADDLSKFYYEDKRAIFKLFESMKEAQEQKQEELAEHKKSKLN